MIPKIYFPSIYEFPDFKINWYNMILQTETGQTQDNRHIYAVRFELSPPYCTLNKSLRNQD